MPMMGASPAGGVETEMRVDDGAKFGRRHQIGHQIGRHHRWHRQDHAIVAGPIADLVFAEIERRDTSAGEVERAQPVPETHLDACVRRESAAPAR